MHPTRLGYRPAANWRAASCGDVDAAAPAHDSIPLIGFAGHPNPDLTAAIAVDALGIGLGAGRRVCEPAHTLDRSVARIIRNPAIVGSEPPGPIAPMRGMVCGVGEFAEGVGATVVGTVTL
jgi:hypothetical protein